MFDKLIPTTLVGSYPQPDWLVDKDKLLGSGPPRVRMRDVWRVPEALLEQAQDDGTLTALHDQERAGIDIVSDGEIRRESYFNRFANALDGIDIDNPGTVPSRTGKPTQVPRVVGPIQRTQPVRYAMSPSCARIPTGQSRSRFRAPSQWRSWRWTNITATRKL